VLTSALDGNKWSASRSGRLTLYLLERRPGGLQSQYG